MGNVEQLERGKRDKKVAVIGAGPAGLTCAYQLTKEMPSASTRVFEAAQQVGGISRTAEKDGYRFDIGGHRFFTKVPEVEAMWHEVLGDDFIRVRRMSRIYYRGRFFDYPLKVFNALTNMGAWESARIMASYAKWQVVKRQPEDSLEDWVTNRFGGRLYYHFFKSYTEKVWGIPASDINADWAAQRIKSLSLLKVVWNAVSGMNDTTSLIEEFDYPRLGPGMMWEKTADRVEERGHSVERGRRVTKLNREGKRITSIEVTGPGRDEVETVEADEVVNSMDLRRLVRSIDPPPPPAVLEAADKLKYRDFLIVTLVLDHEDPFPDNWIYVHCPEVKVGRIQNFRAWSEEMLPRPDRASVGMEYFCHEGDGLWSMSDDDLIALAGAELEKIGLAEKTTVRGGYVIRQPKAYPVYDAEYQEAVGVIRAWMETIENLQTVGRNGLHRYNNQDHSMLTAMIAAKNIAGAKLDVWDVNVERSYHEEMMKESDEARRAA